jgi:hypothetical protein
MTATKSARRLTERITKSVMATLAGARVRVAKGPLVKSTSAAGQRARQRQLKALGCLLDKAIVQLAIEMDRDDAEQSLAKATRRHETAEVLHAEGTRHLQQQRTDLARLEAATVAQAKSLAEIKARWDKAAGAQAATAARNALYEQRRHDEAAGGFMAQAMATNDPDLRSGYLELMSES